MKTIIPLILAYLKAEPNSKFNHIYSINYKNTSKTIPVRNDSIGLAQYQICFNKKINEKFHQADKVNVRLEAFVKGSFLELFSSKAFKIVKADILAIKVEGSCSACYISTENRWLTSKEYCVATEEVTAYGLKTIFKYDLNKLMADEKIHMLIRDNGIVKEVTGPFSNMKTIGEYEYNDYTKEVNDCIHKHVDRDKRVASGIYYGFGDMKATCYKNTVLGLANDLLKYTNLSLNTIYQRLQYAKRETVLGLYNVPATFKFSKDGFDEFTTMYDKLELSSDDIDTLVVWLSHETGPIHEKPKLTEDLKEYQKEYQKKNRDSCNMKVKVKTWLKRHNGEFNSKWSDEEREFAETLMQK